MSASHLEDLIETKYGWHVRFDKTFDPEWKPFGRPRFRQAIEYIPLLLRYMKVLWSLKRAKRRPHMDFLNPIPLQQIYGAPMGGLGCGTIGRGFKGEFCRYQLVPGLYEFQTVEANTFTVCVRRRDTTHYCQVLTTEHFRSQGLRSWNAAFPKENGRYQALFPQSWTIYDLPGQNIRLLCKQVSPFIPNNYEDASLPVSSLIWYIENMNDEPVEVSLMFMWQAGSASEEYSCTQIFHESVTVNDGNLSASGVSIKQNLREMPLEYCILAKQETDNKITTKTNFNTKSTAEGQMIWNDLTDDGHLNSTHSSGPIEGKLGSASCVCVSTTINPNSIKTTEFALAWNMPKIRFGLRSKEYQKYYTRFFDPSKLSGATICLHAIKNRPMWEKSINDWQKTVLDDSSLPDWYKSALFNESYFISDGGSIWLDVSNDENASQHVRKWGRFGYLEGHEYRMVNTYDVHFYASFALIRLWPQLELSIQYDYASVIGLEKLDRRVYLFDGHSGPWKTIDAVPHDLGDPDEEPWLSVNAYNVHDTAEWKDLGPKYLLQIYRDYIFTKNEGFLREIWATVKLVTDRIKKQDTNNDGLVDNGGFPDQTYDAWTAAGASAYCGGLQIAALRACIEMATIVNDVTAQEEYQPWLELAKKSYSNLWNGEYYNYDSSTSNHRDSIMSDQLAGFWYLRMCGHQYEDFEKERVQNALKTIFKMNVMKFGDGKFGAVNGMTRSGEVEIYSLQSEEVWSGTTYALSSTMIMESLTEQAFLTASGMYENCFDNAGLAFQTPEAITRNKNFRSCGYMRPLSIWAIQKAVELSREQKNV